MEDPEDITSEHGYPWILTSKMLPWTDRRMPVRIDVADHRWTTAEATAALMSLSPDDRMEVFDAFCAGCGTDDLPCHCMNDE